LSSIYVPRFLCILACVDFSFFSFSLHFRETYVEQEQGENANDRNDRAIRVAAKWYNEHLKKMSAENQLQVIFITNDRKNKEKAVEEGIPAFTCRSKRRCFFMYIEKL
jgi:exosome complex exonuclease DIS3/RRP44